ncbi:MAG: DUF4845 domain-containing protein [Pseudomonadota bacterium]
MPSTSTVNPGIAPPWRGSRGVTLPTLIVILAGLALIALGVFRLIPVYIGHMKVVGAMTSVQNEFEGENASRLELLAALEKRFDIEMIDIIRYRDVKVERDGDFMSMTAQYENEVPFIANVHFLVRFDHSVSIARDN